MLIKDVQQYLALRRRLLNEGRGLKRSPAQLPGAPRASGGGASHQRPRLGRPHPAGRARAATSPPPRPAPPFPAVASSSPGGRVHPRDRPAPADARRPGKREATLGRRRRQRGRGAGAQMGATEKGGKKSRRLFSSLRPWKATRRLWRTRSAPKAAQGECGRGGGDLLQRAAGSDWTAGGPRWLPQPEAASRAHLSVPGSSGWGAARPGCLAWPGRPSTLTFGPCDKPDLPSSHGAAHRSAGAGLGTVPFLLLPLSISRWARWLQFVSRKSPCL